MARSGGSSLLIPLILAFIIGLLLYFYWGASSQVVSLKTDNNGLKKELRAARNERDNLQYRLNLLREDLDVALQKKEEADRRFQEEEELVQGADAKIVGLKWAWSVYCLCKTLSSSYTTLSPPA